MVDEICAEETSCKWDRNIRSIHIVSEATLVAPGCRITFRRNTQRFLVNQDLTLLNLRFSTDTKNR
jgi:hypothetical protein